MKYLSYHGKLDETHLKSINVTLHTIAQSKWSIVRNYSRQYNLAWKAYIQGMNDYLDNTDGLSNDYNTKTNTIFALVNTMVQQDASTATAVNEAIQEANEAETEVQNETSGGLTPGEQALGEAVDTYNQAEEALRDAQQAFNDARIEYGDATQNSERADNALAIATTPGAVGTGSYVDPDTNQPHTVTNDGNGTVTVTGVTLADGTVGTVTTTNGVSTFTADDGSYTGPFDGSAQGVVQSGAQSAAEQVSAAAQDFQSKAEQQQAAEEAKQQAQQEADSKALDYAEEQREEASKNDPDTSNGNDDWGDWEDFVNG